jgi:hypothetical protein
MEDLHSGVPEDPILCQLAAAQHLRSLVSCIKMLVEYVGLVIVPLNTGTVIFIYCTYVKSNYVRKSKENISKCLLGTRRIQ